jgi:hypothetical protein
VSGQRLAISDVAAAIGADTFGNIEDDTSKAIFVQINFLVVGNLTDGTVSVDGLVGG